MKGRGNFLCSLRFYASNALAGALYLVTIFVGKDTLAASCGFSRCTRAENWRYVSPLYLQGERRCISRRPGGWGVTVNGHISIPIYTCIQTRFLFYISVADTATE